MCYITYSFIKRNEWGNPLFIIEWGEKMELLESIKEMVLPLIEQNDCYLDDIEYIKDFELFHKQWLYINLYLLFLNYFSLIVHLKQYLKNSHLQNIDLKSYMHFLLP